MRILWLSHLVPFPPRGGNVQRSYNLLRQAAHFAEVSLVALNLQGEAPERLREHREALETFCAGVEIWNLPYPWKGSRWWAEALRSPLYATTFSSRAFFSDGLCNRWERKLADYQDAVVHVDSIDLALYIAAIGRLRKVLNHHNCESALALRRAAQETNPVRRRFLQTEAWKLARLEHAHCGNFNVNMAVCEEDRKRLLAASPSAHFHVVENGVDTDYFQPIRGREEGCTAIFTGTLDWQPNLSAVRYLIGGIWPLVRQGCPDAKLILAGKNPPAEIFRLAGAIPGVEVFPNPWDMRPLLARAAVYVCPILEGGGTRLKILDAMAMGKAVVSTTIGCEGLRVKPQRDILRRDQPGEFASAVLRLFREEDLRSVLGRSSREVAEREYSWVRAGGQLKIAYECAARKAQPTLRGVAHVDASIRDPRC